MQRAHKIRLTPKSADEECFQKACGIARFTWNWPLGQWNEEYKAGLKPNALALKKRFNALKEKEFPWIYEVTKYASQQPFIFLSRAFSNFFRDCGKPKKAKQFHYPKFKKKGKCRDSFYIGGDQVKVLGDKVKIPNLGWVEMTEHLRWQGKIESATVTRHADKWFISFCVETSMVPSPCESQASVGVDLGVSVLATLSDGQENVGAKPLKTYLRRLKRLQRARSKAVLGSNNFSKLKLREARLHYKIYCIRKDALHKLTSGLVDKYRYISIEDLNIRGMLLNHKLARAIADMGFYEFKRQLLYKAAQRGNTVLVMDPWFASTKTCCVCDAKKTVFTLGERIFQCENCGLKIGRDLNASRTLEKQLFTGSSPGIYACGQNGSFDLLQGNRKPVWLNQEKEPVQICIGF